MVLRRIFGLTTDEAMGEWRKLHNGQPHNLHAAPNNIRQITSSRMSWAGHLACMAVERRVYKGKPGKPEGKRPLRRLRHRRKNGIKMDITKIDWEGVEWIHLAQGRNSWQALVNIVMNLQVLAPQS
jgi:hypothetical protein